MTRTLTRTPGRSAAWIAFAALSLSGAPIAGQAAKQSPGIEFDMKTTMNMTGGMGDMLAGMKPGYSGHGVQVGRRTRIDILEGSLPPMAEKGDYILFDTSGMTVVHPSKKEYVPIPKDFASKALDQMQAMGMSITVGGVSAKIDSLPGVDTIAGLPTRHYRTTIAYTMTLEGMGQSQQMSTNATGDYWMATIPGLAESPLQRTSALGGGQGGTFSSITSGPFKDIAAKMDSVTRKMSGTAVRTKTTSTSDTGAGTMNMEVGSEMLNLKHSAIDESLFVVPSDYTKGASPFPTHH